MIILGIIAGCMILVVTICVGFTIGSNQTFRMFKAAMEYRAQFDQQKPPQPELEDEDEKTIEDFLLEQVQPGTYVWETDDRYHTTNQRGWPKAN